MTIDQLLQLAAMYLPHIALGTIYLVGLGLSVQRASREASTEASVMVGAFCLLLASVLAQVGMQYSLQQAIASGSLATASMRFGFLGATGSLLHIAGWICLLIALFNTPARTRS
jgi:hypothetical protein